MRSLGSSVMANIPFDDNSTDYSDDDVSAMANIRFDNNSTHYGDDGVIIEGSRPNIQVVNIYDESGNVVENITDFDVSMQQDLVEQQEILMVREPNGGGEEELAEGTNPSKKTRKRVSNSSAWKVTVRKKKYQSDEEFVNVRGKVVPQRITQNLKNCLQNCKFYCAKQITEDERFQVFNRYRSLTQNEKYVFLKTTSQKMLKRRNTTAGEPSRRSFTFNYFFEVNEEKIKV